MYDNGPQYTSEEIMKFLQDNAVKRSQYPPYHSSSNGDVECWVCTFKQAMKVGKHDKTQLDINSRTSLCPTEQQHHMDLLAVWSSNI